jgi:D-glycero-D-manno-heptose 1,7-bisphosphate phosphatase
MRRAVFLDRDGVLNRAIVRGGKPYPPASVDELEILPGVEDACRLLKEAGLKLIVVTNQPDVARGTTRREVVEEINRALQAALLLDDIRVCYHDDDAGCFCRKPKPGLIINAAKDWEIALQESFLVGDRWKDIEAGNAAGCHTIFINYGYSEPSDFHRSFEATSLLRATPYILGML